MAATTLKEIRNKVRKLTQSPSITQLSIVDLDQYINTFILYDFPETLRLFSLKKSVKFTLEPNIDTYTVNSVLGVGAINEFITFNPPVYIAGFPAFYSQSEEEFFNIYPFHNSIKSTGLSGDGATFVFSGTLSSKPVIRGKVCFTAKAAPDPITGKVLGLILSDTLVQDGFLRGDGQGTIDYLTGAFTLDFGAPPAFPTAPLGVINSQTVPYVAGRPTSMLYFNDTFIFRPIPDQVYHVQLEAFVRPTDLLALEESPELEQWWQYIAYGAAKKVLEDRMDMETVQMIMPEFNRQERMVLRRTIVQQTNERTATIYTGMTNLGAGFGFGFGSN